MKTKQHFDVNSRILARPGRNWIRYLLPTPGNIIFTLLVLGSLFWASSAGALVLPSPAATNTSASAISYQGRLGDSDGAPLTGSYEMIFRLYGVGTGGAALWEEQWAGSNSVAVNDGLFNVMLGSLTPIPQSAITDYDTLYLGVAVSTDNEMTPRVQVGSVPYAIQALTVPDGSVITEKLADGAVTSAKLGADVDFTLDDGEVTTAKLADNAVTSGKIADGTIATSDLADGSITQAKTPSLLKAQGNNQVMRRGNAVITTDSNGEGTINFGSPFPNDADVIVAINGDPDAARFTVHIFDTYTANPGFDKNGFNFRLYALSGSVFANKTVRIMYIAIGH